MSLPVDTIAIIDATRGAVSRSAVVTQLLDEALAHRQTVTP